MKFIQDQLLNWYEKAITGYLKRSEEKRGKGIQALPRRWVVERTFAWVGNYRPFSKDYEV